ncbi:MAG: NAD(P)/FAD-dependent oxidoreductase [Desulfobacteraceae bacterium]|nr:MAG: NAD(P)/FAD-dependent oxidoreductase [Desulfobacteraceae bacterium]
MTDYDAVIIGAGNGGLTAGLTLARAGVKTLMLERHNIPGGCATSFVRGRFEFEVALHQLSGMGTESFPGPLRSMLKDLDMMKDLAFVQMENLYRAVLPGQMDITLKADRAEAIQALKAKFPQETSGIDGFFDLVWAFCNQWIHVVIMKDPEATSEKHPVYFQYALKDTQSVLDEFFKNPLLKSAVGIYWSYMGMPPSRLPFGDFAVIFWAYTEFKPFHIKGGSQALSNALLNAYIQAGGDVHFNCGVKKIIVKDNRVTGIVTDQGDEIATANIVSNAGTYTTYVELIDREHIPEESRRELGARTVGTSAVTIFLGMDAEPEALGIREATNFITETTDNDLAFSTFRTLDPPMAMLFTCYDVDDPEFSPKGACQAAIVSLAYSEPWLSIPTTRYHETKYRYAQDMLNTLYKVFPDVRHHIEEIDVATPLTHMRYLGHPGGAIYGFEQSARDSELFLDGSSPIEGLYHAGAFAGMGGFQPTLMSGQSAARKLIRQLK